MKKILALILSLILVLALLVACGEEEATDPHAGHDHEVIEEITPQETTPAETEEQSHDHNHINYKGLNTASYTLDDVVAVEGAEPAFSFEAGGITYYAYNNVTEAGLEFTQVQHSFMGDYNRISCTASEQADPAAVLELWKQTMTELYGEAMTSDNGTLRWTEHTGNYVTLTQLNENTVQLCYYFIA